MPETANAKALRALSQGGGGSMSLGPLLDRLVGRFESGTLTLELPSARRVVLAGKSPGRNAHIAIRKWRALLRMALSGDVGFAESLADGDCESEDLKDLLLWAIENTDAGHPIGNGLAASHILGRLRHGLRANNRSNSRRNIVAHYDLGNDFYSAWLDCGMNYSSGIYEAKATSLADAQRAKIKHVRALLDARSGDLVLEIGCGWGSLARDLVTQAQCEVTGITLSERQLAYAKNQLTGFERHADIRLQDYRDLRGKFDRIVSIEMIEAVGEAYWPVFFDQLKSLLADDGTVVLQAITIDESRYEGYRRRPDFIQLSIFPGGMLPTKSIIADQASRAGLELVQADYFGDSYARTLSDWRENFNAAWPAIARLGFDERFRRLWDYYLVYCEAGFKAGWLDVGLYKLRHTPISARRG